MNNKNDFMRRREETPDPDSRIDWKISRLQHYSTHCFHCNKAMPTHKQSLLKPLVDTAPHAGM
jgi:hypothetical protein